MLDLLEQYSGWQNRILHLESLWKRKLPSCEFCVELQSPVRVAPRRPAFLKRDQVEDLFRNLCKVAFRVKYLPLQRILRNHRDRVWKPPVTWVIFIAQRRRSFVVPGLWSHRLSDDKAAAKSVHRLPGKLVRRAPPTRSRRRGLPIPNVESP